MVSCWQAGIDSWGTSLGMEPVTRRVSEGGRFVMDSESSIPVGDLANLATLVRDTAESHPSLRSALADASGYWGF